MVKNEQKRQKQLAKKRAKEQRKRREIARQKQQMTSLAGQMQAAARGSVYACFAPQELGRDTDENKLGIGSIYFARNFSAGQLGCMVILIDDGCLGVKNVFGRIVTTTQFDEFVDQANQKEAIVAVSPSYARKLTEQAIDYAASLGFSPHSDYRKVAPLWGDVDPSECDTEFTFGKNGKPFYFAGPNDDRARQNLIYQTLRRSVGEGNFDFVLTMNSLAEVDEWTEIDEGRTLRLDGPSEAFNDE